MSRLLFEKTGTAVWMSHLDLMRVFQRSFKRAGLPLTHTQGFNPRPSVSIALPMSVGVESRCELLDFDLEGEKIANEEIQHRLNQSLVDGVRVLAVYDAANKIKHLTYLDCVVTLEYDDGIPQGAREALEALFARESVVVEKRTKNGPKQENIIPMIRKLTVQQEGEGELSLNARICCQNPSLNPMQLVAAIEKELPACKPSFAKCRRVEVYDSNETVFR